MFWFIMIMVLVFVEFINEICEICWGNNIYIFFYNYIKVKIGFFRWILLWYKVGVGEEIDDV